MQHAGGGQALFLLRLGLAAGFQGQRPHELAQQGIHVCRVVRKANLMIRNNSVQRKRVVAMGGMMGKPCVLRGFEE